MDASFDLDLRPHPRDLPVDTAWDVIRDRLNELYCARVTARSHSEVYPEDRDLTPYVIPAAVVIVLAIGLACIGAAS